MKKFVFVLCAALFLAGCSWVWDGFPESQDFVSSGCASETKAGLYDAESELMLKYTPEGLLVSRKNAEMNCAIKDGGIDCEVSVDRNVIKYIVRQKSELSANCTCLVEEMSSTISGLKEGSDYNFYYSCQGEAPLVPISFTYKKGFVLVVDTELYAAPLVDLGDGTWGYDI